MNSISKTARNDRLDSWASSAGDIGEVLSFPQFVSGAVSSSVFTSYLVPYTDLGSWGYYGI